MYCVFQKVMSQDEIVHMLAHEVGHNLNSMHDEDTKNCNKSGYIMSIWGAKENSKRFSQCSVKAFYQEIDRLRSDELSKNVRRRCLKNLPFKENDYDDLVISETRKG